MTAQTLAAIAAWSTVAAIACLCVGALLLARATRLPLWTTTILTILLARGATSMLYAVGIGAGTARVTDIAIAVVAALGAMHAAHHARPRSQPHAVVRMLRRRGAAITVRPDADAA